MPEWFDVFRFQAQHIFPESLPQRMRDNLLSVGMNVDSRANLTPMFSEKITTQLLQSLPEGVKEFFEKAGWSLGRHDSLDSPLGQRTIFPVRTVPMFPWRSLKQSTRGLDVFVPGGRPRRANP